MWYRAFCLLAFPISLFAGGLGNVGWFAVSVLLFASSVLAAKIETRDPTWIAGTSFALIWLGATGGLSWPVLRIPLIVLGVILGGICFWQDAKNRKQKIVNIQESEEK